MRSRREQVPFSLPEDRSKWFELVSWAPDVAEHLRRRWTRDAKTGRLGDICANELNAMHDAYSRARQLRATIVSQANSAAIIEVFDAFVRAQGHLPPYNLSEAEALTALRSIARSAQTRS
jgi:hypothetical protein